MPVIGKAKVLQWEKANKTTIGRTYKKRRIEAGTFRCDICGYKPHMAYYNIMHVHHVLPRSKGGSNRPSNLVLLCPTCHQIAHATIRIGKHFKPFTKEAFLWIMKHIVKDYNGFIKRVKRHLGDRIDEYITMDDHRKPVMDLQRLYEEMEIFYLWEE